jgi:Fic/DOC family
MRSTGVDSPELRRNLDKVSASIQKGAERRVIPAVETAKVWQKLIMSGLGVLQPLYAGHFRGEPGLERCGVGLRHGANVCPGANPWDVADELKAFEAKLQAAVARLDAQYPDDDSLDDDGMSAAIDLAAWAHAEWIRIHPFANGNGRTARLWANLLLMRYGLPPVVTLRPRPGGGYGAAGAAAMQGDWQPTRRVFRGLALSVVMAAPATSRKLKPP